MLCLVGIVNELRKKNQREEDIQGSRREVHFFVCNNLYCEEDDRAELSYLFPITMEAIPDEID